MFFFLFPDLLRSLSTSRILHSFVFNGTPPFKSHEKSLRSLVVVFIHYTINLYSEKKLVVPLHYLK